MRLSFGMDTIGLKQGGGVRCICHAFEQERHKLRALLLTDAHKHSAELLHVLLAIVGGDLHADQEHGCFRPAASCHHLRQVVFGGFQGKATQCIVATELDYHQLGLVLLQQLGQPRQTASRGVATDAGVDHLPWPFVLGQLLVKQGHPTGASGNAVFRTQ